MSIAVDEHALRDAVGTGAGLHAVLDVMIEGTAQPHVAIVKDYELDKVKHIVTHVDFQEIKLTELIESNVTVSIEGTPVGVSLNGGLLDVVTREVTVSALPTDIPEHFTLNVEALDVGDVFRVADLQVPANVTILDDLEEVVCSVLAPRLAEAEAVEEGEGGAGRARDRGRARGRVRGVGAHGRPLASRLVARAAGRAARRRSRQPRGRYASSRHNAGFLVVDALARRTRSRAPSEATADATRPARSPAAASVCSYRPPT